MLSILLAVNFTCHARSACAGSKRPPRSLGKSEYISPFAPLSCHDFPMSVSRKSPQNFTQHWTGILTLCSNTILNTPTGTNLNTPTGTNLDTSTGNNPTALERLHNTLNRHIMCGSRLRASGHHTGHRRAPIATLTPTATVSPSTTVSPTNTSSTTATEFPTNTMSTTVIGFPTAILRLITKTSPISSVSLTISGSPLFTQTPIGPHMKHLHPFQPHLT
jgi:hypothetical protein